ncbi:hypothetical protein BV22DRAFT_1135742 [Leucogyrophana mollusca]|uniref:Uncharacterized protein n=1 Tax=Leucogyrophana mollusca TaxID=85980 RepID=A0ACB8AWW1_9AGAM|nr:hypothetical protein BV22DRAFT_1135742 [Leucogyrophana mollusca]
MLCQTCCVAAHKRLPLHVIKKWNGKYFERASLKEMGLRIQLEHEDMHCISPLRGHVDFVVIHLNGIHHVKWIFVTAINAFHIANNFYAPNGSLRPSIIHKQPVSAYEYYVTLERLTDNTGLWVPKSQYKAFM